MSTLRYQSVGARYGDLRALQDVSFDVPPGSRVAIFGHNGAGKTTLLRCAIGAIAGASGRVTYGDAAIVPGAVHRNARLGIGLVAQGHNVFRELPVGQNLAIAGLLHGEEYADEVYRMFPVLRERRAQLAGSLSGGEQQMLALGMALMTRPSLLLLDEPSTGLAPIVVKEVFQSLRRVNERSGTTIVMVEQSVQLALREVSRALILKSGRLVFDGPGAQLAAKTDLWEWF